MLKFISVFKLLSNTDKELKQKLKNILGFSPNNISLYKQAFRHKSAIKQTETNTPSNQRLEFLGDAVFGTIVAEHLFKLYPTKDEGFLTQIRSRIVNGKNLFLLAKKFGFDSLLNSKLTKKEKLHSSAYGDVFESFIGAIFLDKGFEKTKYFVIQKIINPHINIGDLVENDTDYKSRFQIMMQRQKKQFEYVVLSDEKVGKEKLFKIQLNINGIEQAVFEHKSKKVAEQKAAQLALQNI